jgi:hypothetical protein
MPTVKTYGQRQVMLAPIPGVRKQAHLTAEALGAGTEIAKSRASEEMGAFGATAARIGINEYAEIREQGQKYQQSVQRLELSNQMSQWKSQQLFTPGTGALYQEGKNSFHLPEEVGGEFDQYTGELEATISDPETRLWFANQKLQEGAQIDLTLRRHVLGESQKYEAQQTQALKENKANEAIVNALDAPAVTRAINEGVTAIKEHAGRMGQSDDAIKDQVRDYQSAVLTGVILRLSDTHQRAEAQKRFKDAKDDKLLNGPALEKIEKVLAVGTTNEEAQKLADDILANPELDTLAKQQEAARAGASDTDARQRTNDLLEHAATLKRQAKLQSTETLLDTVYTRLNRNGGDLSSITDKEEEALGADIARVRNFAQTLQQDGKVLKDDIRYVDMLWRMASSNDPKEVATFKDMPLVKLSDKMTGGTLESFMRMQATLRGNEAGAQAELAKKFGKFRTVDQVTNDTLRSYGLDPTPKDDSPQAQAIGFLREQLRTDLAAQEAEGKPVGPEDIKKHLDYIMAPMFTRGGFFTTSEHHIASEMTIDDVSSPDRVRIENRLREEKYPVTERKILEVYQLEQMAKARLRQKSPAIPGSTPPPIPSPAGTIPGTTRLLPGLPGGFPAVVQR